MASHKLTSGVDLFAERSSAISRELRALALGGVKLLFGTYFHREVLARLRKEISMKILRIVAITMLMVTMIPNMGVAQTKTADTKFVPYYIAEIPKGYKPTPIIHAVVPTELGCYVETTPGKLTKVDCLSAEEIAKYLPPAPCAGADGDAACGMQSTVTAIQRSFGINQIPITEAFLEVTLQQYSSSVDTGWGTGAYSLQLNTNFFGPMGHQGWVQFVYQDFLSSARFCVWNIDVSTNTYRPVCTPYSSVPLGARAQFTVGGFVCAESCTYFRPGGTGGPAVIWGWMHWDVLDARGNVCSSCGSGTVWAVAPDTYGLASNWLQVSGSILGAGGGSKINFAAYAVDQNVLGATACPIPLAPGWTCATPQLNGHYDDTAGWVTAESNNLYYAPSPNWVVPQVPQSTLTCSNGFCWFVAYEIYPNK